MLPPAPLDPLALGVHEMDAEHGVMAGLLDALDQSLRDGHDTTESRVLLAQFVDYTSMHFVSEQLLMRFHAYPLFEAHVSEHDDLLGHLRELQATVESGALALSQEQLGWIRSWHTRHVRGMDRTLADYLAAHPPAPPTPERNEPSS